MCRGHGVYVKAVMEYDVLELRDVDSFFLVQTKHFKPKLGLTLQSNMFSNGNQGTWPSRQGGLVRKPYEERMTQY